MQKPCRRPAEDVQNGRRASGGRFHFKGDADGEVGVFQAGSDGAVHALWGSATGQWQEVTLTGTGVAAPGGGVGATVSLTAGADIRGAAVLISAGKRPARQL